MSEALLWVLIFVSGPQNNPTTTIETFKDEASCRAVGDALYGLTHPSAKPRWKCVSVAG